jgi:hypothetical protein
MHWLFDWIAGKRRRERTAFNNACARLEVERAAPLSVIRRMHAIVSISCETIHGLRYPVVSVCLNGKVSATWEGNELHVDLEVSETPDGGTRAKVLVEETVHTYDHLAQRFTDLKEPDVNPTTLVAGLKEMLREVCKGP